VGSLKNTVVEKNAKKREGFANKNLKAKTYHIDENGEVFDNINKTYDHQRMQS